MDAKPQPRSVAPNLPAGGRAMNPPPFYPIEHKHHQYAQGELVWVYEFLDYDLLSLPEVACRLPLEGNSRTNPLAVKMVVAHDNGLLLLVTHPTLDLGEQRVRKVHAKPLHGAPTPAAPAPGGAHTASPR